LEPFLAGACLAFREWAGTEVAVWALSRSPVSRAPGAVTAVLGLMFATEGWLMLSCGERTAAAFAERALAGGAEAAEPAIIRDCLGELANIIAGQAKALLANSPY